MEPIITVNEYPPRMGMARQSTLRGLYLANRNILYYDR